MAKPALVLPRIFAEKMGIGKGDFLKVHLEEDKLVVEKADI
jgi:bifunctional DNA-binding transcriptional regulator/antitoxin component of YhaV-PrlF toxin-antitoxin module